MSGVVGVYVGLHQRVEQLIEELLVGHGGRIDNHGDEDKWKQDESCREGDEPLSARIIETSWRLDVRSRLVLPTVQQ